MADQQDQPGEQAAKKAAMKKAPAKQAAAKKAPARRAPAKKAAAKQAAAKRPAAQPGPSLQPALEAAVEIPALEPAPRQAELTAGPNAARETAATAKETVRQAGAGASTPVPAGVDFGLRLPLTIGLAAVSFIALLLRRLRRG